MNFSCDHQCAGVFCYSLQALEDAKEEFRRQVEAKRERNEMTAEEYQRLLKEHENEISQLEATIDGEKQKQQQSLSDRLAERKRRLAAKLAKKNEAEMSAELERQQQERDDLQAKKVSNPFSLYPFSVSLVLVDSA